jgi:iron complex transport system substrate-binding protein
MQIPRHRHSVPELCALVLIALLAVRSPAAEPKPLEVPKRIVSMAPSVTEVLYALELGPRTVGVTRFCDYPPEAKAKPKVGGFLDPNYEAIVALKPDLVVILTSHKNAVEHLKRLRLKTLVVRQECLADIDKSIVTIGEACGKQEEAKALLTDLRKRIQNVRTKIAGRQAPNVLVCVGRDLDGASLGSFYAAGRQNFYDEILTVVGATNVCASERIAYPQLSKEGLIRLDPDVILDVVGPPKKGTRDVEALRKQWLSIRQVKAVKNGRVHVIVGTRAMRPGPRYALFLEDVARIAHPEAKWESR